MLRRGGEVPLDQPRDSLVAVGIARLVDASPQLARLFDSKFTPNIGTFPFAQNPMEPPSKLSFSFNCENDA
jgi:hypothetical protein